MRLDEYDLYRFEKKLLYATSFGAVFFKDVGLAQNQHNFIEKKHCKASIIVLTLTGKCKVGK